MKKTLQVQFLIPSKPQPLVTLLTKNQYPILFNHLYYNPVSPFVMITILFNRLYLSFALKS